MLNRVPAFASARRSREAGEDRQSLRAELFRGLRELFSRVAQHHPLVLLVDDVQWADADTWGALEAIMRPPDAPRLLLLLTLRADAVDWDLGYPRAVQRADGIIVAAYYYNDRKGPERYIAATLWKP